MKKTWLVTGCSEGGLGAAIARTALEAGYNVAVTARNIDKMRNLIKDFSDTAFPVVLDVTDKKSIEEAVKKTAEHFGTIDILVNNAGYCYRSSVEESEDEEVMKMFQTNLFGLISLTKAVLPYMRSKRSGMIINFSSIAALSANAASAFYASSKAAVELLSDGLRAEVEPLGIKVMIVEPGPFRTNFFNDSLKGTNVRIEDYKETAWKRYPENTVNNGDQPGSPENAGNVLLKAVESNEPPFRLLLGKIAVDFALNEYTKRISEIESQKTLSEMADYEREN